MQYTTRRKQKDGSYVWSFNAPRDAVLAGVVKSQLFKDGRAARYEVPRLVEKIKLFRKGGIAAVVLTKNNNLRQAITHYLITDHYAKSLADTTKERFETAYKFLNKDMGDIPLRNLNAKDLNEKYQGWLKSVSVGLCNTRVLALTYLFDYLVINGLLEFNFAKSIVRATIIKEEREMKWTKELAAKIVTKALGDFKHSSLGLLILIIYETAQTPRAVQNLLWENLDLEKNCVTFPTTGLTLPLQASTIHLLKQQKEMWGFQRYVLPYHRASDNAYRPLAGTMLTHQFREVKESLGVDLRLDLRQLRTLAGMEMVSVGVEPHELANILNLQPASVKKFYPVTENKTESILAKRFNK